MPSNCYLRLPLQIPQKGELSKDDLLKASELQACFENIQQTSAMLGVSIAHAIAGTTWSLQADQLAHPLSDHWITRQGPNGGREHRASDTESAVYREHLDEMLEVLACKSSGNMRKTAEALCTSHLQRPMTLRSRPVGMDPDIHGGRVLFGQSSAIDRRLIEWREQVEQSNLGVAPTAVAAMATFLNIHPFSDGNGRCARSWFSAILHLTAGAAPELLPIRSIFDVSSGGFEIRLREAEIHHRWGPLFGYFTRIFALATVSTGQQPQRRTGA